MVRVAPFFLTHGVYWPRPSVCLSVCPSSHSHTIAWTRM